MLTDYQKALGIYLMKAGLSSRETAVLVSYYEKEDDLTKAEILVWLADNNPTKQEVLHILSNFCNPLIYRLHFTITRKKETK